MSTECQPSLVSAAVAFTNAAMECRPTGERRFHRTTAGMYASIRYIYGSWLAGSLQGLDEASSLIVCVNDSVDVAGPVRQAMDESNRNLAERLRFVNAIDTKLTDHKKSVVLSPEMVEAYEHNIRFLASGNGTLTAEEIYAENALIAALTLASFNKELLSGSGIEPSKIYSSKEELVDDLLPKVDAVTSRSNFDALASLVALVKVVDDRECCDEWPQSTIPADVEKELLDIIKLPLARLHPVVPWVVAKLYGISYRLKSRNHSLPVTDVNLDNPRILVDATLLKSILRETLSVNGCVDQLLRPGPIHYP